MFTMIRIPRLSTWFLFAVQISICCAANNTTATPLTFAPSQYWDGNDGPWSSFTLRVGTPAQDVRVMVSSIGQETWVVVPEGCLATEPSTCGSLRGGLYYTNESSTWDYDNLFQLGLDRNLGIDANGEYGFETIGLDWQGSGGPTLQKQIIAGIADKSFFLGSFGLTPRSTNFTQSFNDPTPSYMHNLRADNLIPSQSWAYTAGARWRSLDSYASLIFGGYDESLFVANNATFDFAVDTSRDLTVYITSIQSKEGSKSTTLLNSRIGALLDSTLPYLWLPLDVCKQFETEFGLQYDNTTELYLVSDQLHNSLVSRNASFTFSLATDLTSDAAINLTIPYSAFDLEVSWPIIANGTSKYFPLKRAANDTQYTIGRAFMQETYLIVDYERSTFSVHQTKWDKSPSKVVSILPPNSTETTTPPIQPHSKSSLSGGAIGGIVGGVVVVVIIVFVFFFVRRRKSKAPEEKSAEALEANRPELDGRGDVGLSETKDHNELEDPSSPGFSSGRTELEGSKSQIMELPPDFHSSTPRNELEGFIPQRQELASSEETGSRTELESNSTQRHELPPGFHSSAYRTELDSTSTQRHELPTPHHTWVAELEAPTDFTAWRAARQTAPNAEETKTPEEPKQPDESK